MEEESESSRLSQSECVWWLTKCFFKTFQIENLDQILENPRVYNTHSYRNPRFNSKLYVQFGSTFKTLIRKCIVRASAWEIVPQFICNLLSLFGKTTDTQVVNNNEFHLPKLNRLEYIWWTKSLNFPNKLSIYLIFWIIFVDL